MGHRIILVAALLFAAFLYFFHPGQDSAPSFESKKAFEEGMNYYQNQNFTQAESFFTQAIIASPNWEKPYIYYAATLNRLGKYPQALESYEKAHELNPTNFNALEGIVSTYLIQEKNEKAALYLDKMMKLVPNSPKTLRYQGLILFKQKKYQAAIPVLEKCLSDPENAIAFYRLANCYKELKQEEKQLATYQQGVLKHPRESSLFRSYLSLAQDMGKEDEVMSQLRNQLKNPKTKAEEKVWFKLYLGQTLLQKETTQQEGEKYLTELTKSKQFSLEASLILARRSVNQQQFPQAVKYLKERLEEYPFHPTLLAILGEVYRFQGTPKKAQETFKNWFTYTKQFPIERKIPIILNQIYTHIDLKEWKAASDLIDRTHHQLQQRKEQGSQSTINMLIIISFQKAILPLYQEKFSEVLTNLNKLLATPSLPAPLISSYQMKLAFTYWAMGEKDNAIKIFKETQEKFKEDPETILSCLLFEGILTQKKELLLQAETLVREKKLHLDPFKAASIRFLAGVLSKEKYEKIPRTFIQNNDYYFYRYVIANEPAEKKEWLRKTAQFYSLTDFPSFIAHRLFASSK